jgi:hypothetical protein
MTRTCTRSAHQLGDQPHRSAGMWIVAVTAALLALATLLMMTSSAAASGEPGCPPPSAQLAAAQPEPNCSALGESFLTSLSPAVVNESVEADVVQTPTGTTTLPDAAP